MQNLALQSRICKEGLWEIFKYFRSPLEILKIGMFPMGWSTRERALKSSAVKADGTGEAPHFSGVAHGI
ncbi:MAG: hypothetical protein DRN14_06760 [Thermoplasmata archaeon]|nr:MAG: hypothetical protein DRN14_06760 [Thermoplasmata archaeon]